MKEIFIKIAPEEALKLIKILTDEDEAKAFAFVREILKPHLDQAMRGGLDPFPFKLRVS